MVSLVTKSLTEGNTLAKNRRCQSYSFATRQELFGNATNFLLVPGDNDWNECYGYDISSNGGDLRDLWRQTFALDAPFNEFSADFPGGDKPFIHRKTTPDINGYANPELFYFLTNSVAVFGLNFVSGNTYLDTTTINEDWLEDRLNHAGCGIKSIVLVSHVVPKQTVYDKIDLFVNVCGSSIPVLTISGDVHPDDYCLTKGDPDRLFLTIEAFRSGPIKVYVVRDPSGSSVDSFHVEDTDPISSNSQCPDLDPR